MSLIITQVCETLINADTSLQFMKLETGQTPFDLCRPVTGLGRFAENFKFAKMCHKGCIIVAIRRVSVLLVLSVQYDRHCCHNLKRRINFLPTHTPYTNFVVIRPRARFFEQHNPGIFKLPDVNKVLHSTDYTIFRSAYEIITVYGDRKQQANQLRRVPSYG